MKSLSENLEAYKSLEDERMHNYIHKHNKLLALINEIDLDSAHPVQIARAEYYYSQAQVYAYLIAGHYRKQQRYYEAQARQIRANKYEEYRKEKSAADSEAMARRFEGEQEEIAGSHEGNYIRWNGIAQAYENAINSLKDLIKAINKDGG